MERGKVNEKKNGQAGALVVEAVFIFPIVLFILMLIIYLGDIYFQMARVDELVNRYAIEGAQYVADPLLKKVKEAQEAGTGISLECSSATMKLQPYRYVTGALGAGYVSDIEEELNREIKEKLENSSASLFDSVKIRNISTEQPDGKICKYNQGFFSSTFVVQVNYEISYPFYWFGGGKMRAVKASARSECAVNDMDEFIRNIDMVVDLAEGTEFAGKVSGWFNKRNGFIKKFSDWGK